MGVSWSKLKNRHRLQQGGGGGGGQDHHHHHNNHSLLLLSVNPTSSSTTAPPPPPAFQYPLRPPLPPPAFQYPPPPQHQQQPYYNYNYNPPYYNYVPQITGWAPPRPPPPQSQPQPHHPPAPYVDHNNAKRIKNDFNLHKDTITLLHPNLNTTTHLVSFTFDALLPGSITIFYFAKEGEQCTFTPLYPEIVPVKIPFQKGLAQKFCQPSGTGVDLGFFDTDELSRPIPGEDVYPLVISVESLPSPSTPMNELSSGKLVNTSSHAQISQAILEKKENGDFHVKVIKQILWIDGERYELREIFGFSQSDGTTVSDMDSGKECVICMTEVKNTAVLPCRHMCMCSECAKELRLQSDKCPVCRQPIEELLEIKVDEGTGV